jgi:hypothetical protein
MNPLTLEWVEKAEGDLLTLLAAKRICSFVREKLEI